MASYMRTQGLNTEPTLSALTDNGHVRRPVSCDHERAPSAQRLEEVLDAMDVDKGRGALPLQFAPVLGVNPWVEPQDVVLHHGQVRRQTRLAVHAWMSTFILQHVLSSASLSASTSSSPVGHPPLPPA